MDKFATFKGKKYLNLETFRKSGQGVRTPVWFADDGSGSKLYVYTTANSGKAKRIRQYGKARIAACDARGKLTGDWIEVHATLVGRPDFDTGMRLLNRKYWPLKQMLDLSAVLFPKHQRVMIAIRPPD